MAEGMGGGGKDVVKSQISIEVEQRELDQVDALLNWLPGTGSVANLDIHILFPTSFHCFLLDCPCDW